MLTTIHNDLNHFNTKTGITVRNQVQLGLSNENTNNRLVYFLQCSTIYLQNIKLPSMPKLIHRYSWKKKCKINIISLNSTILCTLWITCAVDSKIVLHI